MADRIEAGPPVRLASRPAGPPVRTGWDAPVTPTGPITRLDDLTDVDAPLEDLGLLERQAGGRVRPVPRNEVIAGHVNSPTPHPAYDDLPSLTLLLENRLV